MKKKYTDAGHIDQKYVYIKANISKASKVDFKIGGNLDFSTKRTKDKTGGDSKAIGVVQSIISVTAGIEMYHISTGE